jgi:ribosomal protein L24
MDKNTHDLLLSYCTWKKTRLEQEKLPDKILEHAATVRAANLAAFAARKGKPTSSGNKKRKAPPRTSHKKKTKTLTPK